MDRTPLELLRIRGEGAYGPFSRTSQVEDKAGADEVVLTRTWENESYGPSPPQSFPAPADPTRRTASASCSASRTLTPPPTRPTLRMRPRRT